eukprot:Lankesteria_metandrocarpae@DN1265_c0_g1_i1.p1
MTLPGRIFEDRLLVRSLDNSKFEKVSRIKGKSSAFDADVVLDIHRELFPVSVKESMDLGLATQVTGTGNEGSAVIEGSSYSLMDEYDYVMYGKVFKTEDKSVERRTIYASFGGLLLSLTADKHVVSELVLDLRIYLLLRRADAD